MLDNSQLPQLITTGTFAFYIKGRKSASPPTNIITNDIKTKTLSDSTLPSHTPTPSVVLSAPSSFARQTLMRHNYHILLVEDNLINQKVLRKQLENNGCTVHVANHGVEALLFLEKTTRWADTDTNKPPPIALSLILMDLEMPIMDGLTCARQIRDLEAARKLNGHTPIIAVTANARVEQMNVAMDVGMVSTHFLPSLPNLCLNRVQYD